MRQAERFVALSAAKVDRQKGEATLSFADYRGKAEADTPPSLNVVTVRMVRRGESWAMTGDPVYSSP